MKIGFVVNPLAGIGGSVALKGSDGDAIVDMALAKGAVPQAEARAKLALQKLAALDTYPVEVSFLTASGTMGEQVLENLNLSHDVVYFHQGQSTSKDTENVVALFADNEVDLIVFAGGDGTARDVFNALTSDDKDKSSRSIPVIGIPAGVKIHSAVYAVTPVHAGEIIDLILQGQAMTLHEAQVMDLDEEAFRQGNVNAKCYGYLSVPIDDTRMQLIKQGGLGDDDLSVQEIAAEVIETMEQDIYYLMGSGSTTAEIMNQLNLGNTLLGIDVVLNQKLIASDADEKVLLQIVSNNRVKVVVTVIGGQGHVFGRGNQQLSSQVIDYVINQDEGLKNILIVATNAKLQSLEKRPMIADTGSSELNKKLSGLYPVITGYQQKTLYSLN